MKAFVPYGISLFAAVLLWPLMENDTARTISVAIPIAFAAVNFIVQTIALSKRAVSKLATTVKEAISGEIDEGIRKNLTGEIEEMINKKLASDLVDQVWYRIDSRYGPLMKAKKKAKGK